MFKFLSSARSAQPQGGFSHMTRKLLWTVKAFYPTFVVSNKLSFWQIQFQMIHIGLGTITLNGDKEEPGGEGGEAEEREWVKFWRSQQNYSKRHFLFSLFIGLKVGVKTRHFEHDFHLLNYNSFTSIQICINQGLYTTWRGSLWNKEYDCLFVCLDVQSNRKRLREPSMNS